jgi:glycosyltransferase involved in cell wall biosynthesis
MPKVAILMGLCEGQNYLRAQLDSIARQTESNWLLVVSDDSTTPDGRRILMDFARGRSAGQVRILTGPRRGIAQNYLHLLQNIPPDVGYVAFCDQDDVWVRDKLSRAVAALSDIPHDQPAALFAGRVACDAQLRRQTPLGTPRRPPSFRNALVQNILPGNTLVLNAAAARLCVATSRWAVGIAMHDWWIYQVVTGAGGRVLFDPAPAVLYRQHDANAVGAAVGFLALLTRLARALGGRHRVWVGAHLRALQGAAAFLTPENHMILAQFVALRRASFPRRLLQFAGLGLYRQTGPGQGLLWLQMALGRI